MSTHNIYFYGELTKIILQLSSNTLLICSSGLSCSLYWKSMIQSFSMQRVNIDQTVDSEADQSLCWAQIFLCLSSYFTSYYQQSSL